MRTRCGDLILRIIVININKENIIFFLENEENIILGWAFSRFDFIGPVGPGRTK